MKDKSYLLDKINKNSVDEVRVSDQVAATINPFNLKDSFGWSQFQYGEWYPRQNNTILGLECAGTEIKWGILNITTNTYTQGSIPLGYHTHFIKTALMEDKNLLAFGDSVGNLSILNLSTMKIEAKKKVHATGVTNVQISTNKIMSTCDSNGLTSMYVCYYQPDSKTFNPYNYGRIINGYLSLGEGYLTFAEEKLSSYWMYAITSKNVVKKYLTDRNESKHDQVIASGYQIILCHYQQKNQRKSEYLICKKTNGALAILGDGNYIYNGTMESKDIAFDADEYVYSVTMLSDAYMVVNTSQFLHLIDFNTRKTIGKFAPSHHSGHRPLEPLQEELGFAFRKSNYYDRSSIMFYSLPGLQDLNALISALIANTSVKKFSLMDKHLNVETIEKLYELTMKRPEINYEFSIAIKQQLEIKKKEVELLKDNKSRIDSLEKNLAANRQLLNEKTQELEAIRLEKNQVLQVQITQQQSEIEKKQLEIQTLRNEISAQNGINEQNTLVISQLLEEKHTLEDSLEQLKKAHQSELEYALSLLEKSSQPKPSLRKQLSLNPPSEVFFGQLIDCNEDIHHLNIISYSTNEHVLAIKEELIARGAILDVDTLYQNVTEITPITSQQILKQLILAIEQLLNDFAKDQLPKMAIKQLQVLLLPQIKNKVCAGEETKEELAMELDILKNSRVKEFLNNSLDDKVIHDIFDKVIDKMSQDEKYKHYKHYFSMGKTTLIEHIRTQKDDKRLTALIKIIKLKMQEEYPTQLEDENTALIKILSHSSPQFQSIFTQCFNDFWISQKQKLNPHQVKLELLTQRVTELEDIIEANNYRKQF